MSLSRIRNPTAGGKSATRWPVAGISSRWRRKGTEPTAGTDSDGRAREARTVGSVWPSEEEQNMDWKQMMRSKMACGFSCRRDETGRVEGHGIVKLPKRNAYELVGLRRPLRRETLRLRPVI